MKRSILLVATAVSIASSAKIGVDGLLGLNVPVIGNDVEGIDSKPGFGVALGPTVAFAINDKLAIGTGVSLQYNTYGWQADEEDSDIALAANYSVISLGFQIAPAFKVTEKLSLKIGYEWSMPLSGKLAIESDLSFLDGEEADIIWAPEDVEDIGDDESPILSTHAIVVGSSIALAPNLEFTAQGKIAFNGVRPEYSRGDLKGSYDTEDNFVVHQIAFGVSYDFGR